MKKVTVIDYGAGNLLSLSRALEYCGAQVLLTRSENEIKTAESLILPGVGAFSNGMEGLQKHGLVEPLLRFAASGKPMLGICLGMQMLMEESDEFGTTRGLGVIPGRVEAIPDTDHNGVSHKIPHVGWGPLNVPSESCVWGKTILHATQPGEHVYFVHSFAAHPKNLEHRLADTLYNGRVITAAVRNGNVFGTQFHPEKSGGVGLSVLKSFIDLGTASNCVGKESV